MDKWRESDGLIDTKYAVQFSQWNQWSQMKYFKPGEKSLVIEWLENFIGSVGLIDTIWAKQVKCEKCSAIGWFDKLAEGNGCLN